MEKSKKSLADFVVTVDPNILPQLLKLALVPTSFIGLAYQNNKKAAAIDPNLTGMHQKIHDLGFYGMAVSVEIPRLMLYGIALYKAYEHLF